MKHFSHTYVDARSPSGVREEMLLNFVPSMGRSGYPLASQDERSFTFVHRYRSEWVILFCIIFFPIGLLALLVEKRTATILVSLEPLNDGTQVIFTGQAFGRLRKHIEQMTAAPAAAEQSTAS